MGIFDRFAFWRSSPATPAPERAVAKRRFEAANISRLFADWPTWSEGPNTEVRMSLVVLRARARNLANNNDYARRFLHLLTQNVIGDSGIRMIPDARDGDKVDEDANKKIGTAWKEWCKRGNCTMDGRLSFVDLQRMLLISIARDGEGLARHVRGVNAPNDFGYALQLLEPDFLDERYDVTAATGGKVWMGVELNAWQRPVAYWILTQHPAENFISGAGVRRRRVMARDVLHAYIMERATQVRGLPWMHTAMRGMQQLGGYTEAELVAARTAASKMGFYQSPEGDAPPVDDQDDDGEGGFIQEAEPGVFGVLPPGYEFQQFDPQHPTSAFDAFIKATLRGVASGLDVSYNALANDLEGVNYSSLRQGALDDRDGWRCVQKWYADAVCQPIYEEWLTMGITTGAIDLPMRKIANYLAPRWKARGWQWVDPLKEVNANIAAINNGLMSREDVFAAAGRDLEDTFDQLKKEKDLADEKELVFTGMGTTAGMLSGEAPKSTTESGGDTNAGDNSQEN